VSKITSLSVMSLSEVKTVNAQCGFSFSSTKENGPLRWQTGRCLVKARALPTPPVGR
jgi:hypothetical protein